MKKLQIFIIYFFISQINAQYAKLDATTELEHNHYNDIEYHVYNTSNIDVLNLYKQQTAYNEQIWDLSMVTRSLNPNYLITQIDSSLIRVNGSPLVVNNRMANTAVNWMNWIRGNVNTVAGETGCANCDINVGHILQVGQRLDGQACSPATYSDGNGNYWRVSTHTRTYLNARDSGYLLANDINGFCLSLRRENGKDINAEVEQTNGTYMSEVGGTVMANGGTTGARYFVMTDIQENIIYGDEGYVYFPKFDPCGNRSNVRCLYTELIHGGNESIVKLTQYLVAHPSIIKKYPVSVADLPHSPSVTINTDMLSVSGDNYNVVHNGIPVDYVYYIRQKSNPASWRTLNPKQGHQIYEMINISSIGLTAADFLPSGAYEVVVYMIDGNAISPAGVLGINDNTLINFSIYPNPVQSILTIKSKEKIAKVRVYNTNGQVVYYQDDFIEKPIIHIDLQTLSTGTYLIKLISQGNKTALHKFIKK